MHSNIEFITFQYFQNQFKPSEGAY